MIWGWHMLFKNPAKMAGQEGAPCIILPPGADDAVTPLHSVEWVDYGMNQCRLTTSRVNSCVIPRLHDLVAQLTYNSWRRKCRHDPPHRFQLTNSFYSAMLLHRARLCHSMSSVRPSVRDLHAGTVITHVGIPEKIISRPNSLRLCSDWPQNGRSGSTETHEN